MKFGLTLLMVVASWFVYDHRDLVLDAYRDSESDVDIRLTGIDLDVEKTPLPPSPFQIRGGEDTRRRPLDLAFVDAAGELEAVAMNGGTVTLSGSAFIGSRPAAGATVRIERHTAQGIGSVDVRANSQGGWSAGELPGGRYRLRSWLPGEAVDRAGTVFFVEAGERYSHSFRLEEVDDKVSIQLNNSGVMFDGLTGSVGVSVSQRRVDADGMIANAAVTGARVTLTVTGAATLESTSPIKVDDSGHATFKLRCTRPGSVSLAASVSIPGLTRSASAASTGGNSSAGSGSAGSGSAGSGSAGSVSSARTSGDSGAVRAVGRHPGCREIPPPPPTTVAPKGGDGSTVTTTANTGNGSGPTTTTASTGSSSTTTSTPETSTGSADNEGNNDG